MKAIDQIKEHFAELEPVVFSTEWGFDVWAFPMTLQDQRKLTNKTKGSDDVGRAVEALIMLAKDENGEPLFTREDKPDLMRKATPSALAGLSAKLITAHVVDEDEFEKN